MAIEISGIIGLLIFIASVWAIVHIIQSGESPGVKVLWIVFIILLPLLGLAVWFFAGPRSSTV